MGSSVIKVRIQIRVIFTHKSRWFSVDGPSVTRTVGLGPTVGLRVVVIAPSCLAKKELDPRQMYHTSKTLLSSSTSEYDTLKN